MAMMSRLARKKAQQQKLATKLHFLHTKRAYMLITDWDLFIGSIEDNIKNFIENVSPNYLKNWLQVWRDPSSLTAQKLPPHSP
jgi:hypothetical protein